MENPECRSAFRRPFAGTCFYAQKRKERLLRKLGADLFDLLFSGEIRSCYRSSLQMARQAHKGLRIRLRIEAPSLAAIPWEYLYDKTEGDYLCLSTETPVTRYLELVRPTQVLTTDPPLRILGMVASPTDLPPLEIEKEKQQMALSIEHLVESGMVKLEWVAGQCWRDLQAALREKQWHILHFIGHGGFDTTKWRGANCTG